MACTRGAVRRPEPVGRRPVLGPERDPRAVAGEPEQRRVDLVDRPHHRRLLRVRGGHVRHEPLDARVLAVVQEVRRVGLVPGRHRRTACQAWTSGGGEPVRRPMLRRARSVRWQHADRDPRRARWRSRAPDAAAADGRVGAAPPSADPRAGLHDHPRGVRGAGHLHGDAGRGRRPRRARRSTAGCSAASSSATSWASCSPARPPTGGGRRCPTWSAWASSPSGCASVAWPRRWACWWRRASSRASVPAPSPPSPTPASGARTPPPIRPRVFAVFSSAWVIPGLIGPAASSAIEEAAQLAGRVPGPAAARRAGGRDHVPGAHRARCRRSTPTARPTRGGSRAARPWSSPSPSARVLVAISGPPLWLAVPLLVVAAPVAVRAFVAPGAGGHAAPGAGHAGRRARARHPHLRVLRHRRLRVAHLPGRARPADLGRRRRRSPAARSSGRSAPGCSSAGSSPPGRGGSSRPASRSSPLGIAGMFGALGSLPLVPSVASWSVAGFGIGLAYSPLSVTVLGLAEPARQGVGVQQPAALRRPRRRPGHRARRRVRRAGRGPGLGHAQRPRDRVPVHARRRPAGHRGRSPPPHHPPGLSPRPHLPSQPVRERPCSCGTSTARVGGAVWAQAARTASTSTSRCSALPARATAEGVRAERGDGADRVVDVGAGQVDGAVDAGRGADQAASGVEVAAVDRPAEQHGQVGAHLLEGVEHGQVVDALDDVVAGRLAELRVGGDHVEHVVDDLERHAVAKPELGEEVDGGPGQVADDPADAARGGEQRGGLALDGLQVGRLGARRRRRRGGARGPRPRRAARSSRRAVRPPRCRARRRSPTPWPGGSRRRGSP